MTRILKTSGFLGLATMMSVGLYQGYLFAVGESPPFWLINGHAHLGVLSILAIVTGFSIDALGVTGRERRVVTVLFVVGQWFLPASWWVAFGIVDNIALLGTQFVWGPCLIVAMLVLAWNAATTDPTGREAESRRPGLPR